jgi:hypothetical protein
VSDDGLRVMFGSDAADIGLDFDLYEATRASAADPFAAATPVGGVNTPDADEDNPVMSADGLTLWFDRDRVMRVATRATIDDPFDVDAPAMLSPDADLFAIDLSADGLTLIASSSRFTGEGGSDLFIATRASTADAFPPVTLLEELDDDGFTCCGALSPDGQQLLYTSTSLVPGDFTIAIATRVGDTFTAPTLFAPLAHIDGRDLDVSWAKSGRFVLFTSNRDNAYDLYLVTATCE